MADVTHVLILFMVSVILSFMVDKLTGITADAVAVSVLQNYYKPLTDSIKKSCISYQIRCIAQFFISYTLKFIGL